MFESLRRWKTLIALKKRRRVGRGAPFDRRGGRVLSQTENVASLRPFDKLRDRGRVWVILLRGQGGLPRNTGNSGNSGSRG